MSDIDMNAILRTINGNGIITVPMSFEANLKTASKIYFPFPIVVRKIRAQATKAIAGTDNATVQGANATGDSSGGLITFTASDPIDTEKSANPLTNNTVDGDGYYQLTSAKSTSGGSCLVTIEYERVG